jgi:microsomal dipeptidase-like Zn-dependent dipeptidase
MRPSVLRLVLAAAAASADVVKHINHVVQIAGVDAVGLRSDFDGIDCAPEGLDRVDKWPNLTRALIEEGYTAAEIRKIYGGNTLRLMSAVERTAAHAVVGQLGKLQPIVNRPTTAFAADRRR